MAKKPNAWMAHVMRTKAANPGMQLKDVLRKAGQTYKKGSGASASSSSSASSSTKSHKKHGGLIALPLFGGRKRRGGEDLFGQDAAQTDAAQTDAAQTDAAQTNTAQTGTAQTNAVQTGANEELIQAGGGPLSPADVKSSGTALQLNATAYSGGKKSRRKGSRKSSRKSSRKGKKSSRSRRHRK